MSVLDGRQTNIFGQPFGSQAPTAPITGSASVSNIVHTDPNTGFQQFTDPATGQPNFPFAEQFLGPATSDFFNLANTQLQGGLDANQGIRDQAVGSLEGSQQRLGEQVGGAREELNQAMPLNPFSDQLRLQQFNQLRDQIQRESQQRGNQARQTAASRGVLNSSQTLDIENQIQQDAMRARVAADTDTRMNQFQTNIQANAMRQQLQNPLTQMLTEGTLGLGGLQGQVLAQGQYDPNLFSNLSTGFFGTQLNIDDALRAQAIAERTGRSDQIGNAIGTAGSVLGMAFPGSRPAQMFSAGATALGGFFGDLYTNRGGIFDG